MPDVGELSIIEYIHRDGDNGEFWLDLKVDGRPYVQIGPFDTAEERQRVHDDTVTMLKSFGGRDVPLFRQ